MPARSWSPRSGSRPRRTVVDAAAHEAPQPGWREVLLVAVAVVVVVLGAAAVTGFLPTPIQQAIFHGPVLIVRAHRRHGLAPVADLAGPAGRRRALRLAGRPTGHDRADRHRLQRRRADLDRLADTAWDIVIVGGGIVGAGALLDAATRGLDGRPDRAGRHRVGHLVALVAPHPRRPALPGAAPCRARPGGARRTRPAPAERAASRLAASRSCFPIHGIAVPQQGVLRRRPDPLRHARRAARRRLAPPPHGRRDPGHRSVAAAERPARRPALSRRHGGRRPPGAGGRSGRRSRPRRSRSRSRVSRRVASAPTRRRHAPDAPCARPHVRRRPGDPDPGRRRRYRRLGGRSRPSVLERVDPDPAQPWRAPGRATRAHPGHGRHHDPGPGQGGVPRPVAGPLADRHDRCAVRRSRPPGRPPTAGRSTSSCAPSTTRSMSDLQRSDVVGTYAGLRPLIAPSSGSTVKASREHRVTVERNGDRPDRRRQVHDVPGHGPRRHRRGPRAVRARSACPARRPIAPRRGGRSRRPRADRRGDRRASRPSPPRIPRRPPGSSLATGPRRPASSRSAASSTCCGRSCRDGRSSRPRWRGRCATSSRCRSTTSCRVGCA